MAASQEGQEDMVQFLLGHPDHGGAEAPSVGGWIAGHGRGEEGGGGGCRSYRHLREGPGGGQEPPAAGQESRVEAAAGGSGGTSRHRAGIRQQLVAMNIKRRPEFQ